jgi:hypothetical protein
MNKTTRCIAITATIFVMLYSVFQDRAAQGAKITRGVSHPVLDELVTYLDSKEIDVRTTWDKGKSSTRPTLAPLSDFPAERPQTKRSEFEEGFRTGAAGTVLAIRPTSKTSLDLADDEQKLLTDWLKVPRERRVFVSFSRVNLPAAREVRDALKRKGYLAFIYINTPGETPSLAPEKTGAYFKTAGYHFVIDSPEARTSPAVAYEAHWVTLLPPASPSSSSKTDEPIAFHDSESNGPDLAECWECCTYINGIQTGCAFLGCGEVAHQRGLATCH